jgi:hypothetical protein
MNCPRCAVNFPPSPIEGAGKTGCSLHPRSRVPIAQTKTHTSIQVQRKHSGLPCARKLTGLKSPAKSTAHDGCVHICVAILVALSMARHIDAYRALWRSLARGRCSTTMTAYQQKITCRNARLRRSRRPDRLPRPPLQPPCRHRPRLSHPHNTSMSSISRMGARTPKPHSRASFTVSLLECRFGVMRVNLNFRDAHSV